MWRLTIYRLEDDDITFVSPKEPETRFIENRMGNPKWMAFCGEFDRVFIPKDDIAYVHVKDIGDTVA